MSYTTITPNMGLAIPVVGQEPGPQYASDVNNALTLIDSHSHLAGSGVQITPAAMNINSDLTMGGNNLTNIRSLRMASQPTPISGPLDVGALYESGVDLYFNDGLGNQVRITQSGGVAGTPGSIAGLTSPASATYVSASSTFVWQSNASTPANLDAGSIIIRNVTPSSNGITLSAPTALSSNYTITLPSLPASTALVSIDTSGNLGSSVPYFQALNPAGAITMYGGASAPVGYLLCDGSAVSRTTYASLYGAIGTAYGAGDGSTTFNIPDMRGMFPRGTDNGRGVDPEANVRSESGPGGNVGDNVGSFESYAVGEHRHAYQTLSNTSVLNFASGGSSGLGVASLIFPQTGNPTAGNTSVETRPINIYVNFIIKT